MRYKLALLVLLILGAMAGFMVYTAQNTGQPQPSAQPDMKDERSLEQKMSDRFYEVSLPNLKKVTEPLPILGNDQADEHIVKLAMARGYRLQSLPASGLVDVQGISMQRSVVKSWESLQAAAAEDGVYLGLVSAYRSPDNQRLIFTTQLRDQVIAKYGQSYSPDQIAASKADKLLGELLSAYSIPGYSKHHTGYALDITDTASKKPFEDFEQTAGYRWVAANNYANIRKFGFLPSYPKGAKNQGPQPEPWEYVWVGDAAKVIN